MIVIRECPFSGVHQSGQVYRYSVHPFYTEHRLDASGRGRSHGVLVLKCVRPSPTSSALAIHHACSSSPGDVLLLTPLDSDVSVLQYRFVGGILDLYVFSGPSPVSVVEQYGALVGLPLWTPTWAFGFHLCRSAAPASRLPVR